MTRQHDLHPAETAYYAAIRAGHTWHEVANKAMRVLVERGQPFSADDLREYMGDEPSPPTPHAYGGLFRAWSQSKLIVLHSRVPSRAPKNNGREQKVWVVNRTNTLF